MKILCSLSSIEFRVEHFPFSLSSREASHPVFAIPQKKLLSAIATKYPDGLTPTDAYLGFLALLHSTGNLDWRVPCYRTPKLDALVAQNMELLLRTIAQINTIQHPAFSLPRFVISTDTRELTNVQHWIEAWLEYYSDFQSGNRKAILHDRIATREQAMEKLIKDPSKNPANYANTLAEWAALAGEFPTGTVPVNGLQVSLAEYWKSIIRKCARAEVLFSIDDADLSELIEHCEDTISNHGIFTHTLLKVLRDAAESKRSFLGLGDFDIKSGAYRILGDGDSIETANIMAMVDSAPANEPRQSDYPSKLAYLRAMYKWKAKMDVAEQSDAITVQSNLLEKL